MTQYLVLTLIGEDRPGLVETLAQTVADHQGNWLESNMSHLAGKFAGILRVSVAAERSDALISDLERLSGDLRLLIEKVEAGEEDIAQPLLRLSLVGNDRPGIIREVSRALAAQQVNVENLETECSSAPMSGETLFHARATLRAPAGLSLDELQQGLEQIADDLIVDIALNSD